MAGMILMSKHQKQALCATGYGRCWGISKIVTFLNIGRIYFIIILCYYDEMGLGVQGVHSTTIPFFISDGG